MLKVLNSNHIRLMVASMLTLPGTAIVIFAGSLLGNQFAPDPSLSTLPVASMVVGGALAVVPATRLLKRYGRRKGSLIGLVSNLLGALLGAVASMFSDFTLLILSSMFIGCGQAFVQQYRFAAMECTENKSDIPTVMGILMMAGVVAAWLGPEIALNGKNTIIPESDYAGSYLIAMMMSLLAMTILAGFKPAPVSDEYANPQKTQPLFDILRRGPLLYAVAASAIGYGLMSFLMTATPISMHEIDSHSLEETKWVIQSHIIAMFLPSLLTGWLIARFGSLKILLAGSAVFVGSILLALQGHAIMHYWWSLVLLGLGWNWLFIGGTTLLPETHSIEERFQAQGFNDLVVFSIQASASLSAGWFLHQLGWNKMVLFCLPIIGCFTFVTVFFLVRQNQFFPKKASTTKSSL